MPYRLVYKSAPKNESLPVYKELPEGYKEQETGFKLYSFRVARKGYKEMYYCDVCDGWIEDFPHQFSVNTMSWEHPLSGRNGTEYYCCRCGREIDFIGVMS